MTFPARHPFVKAALACALVFAARSAWCARVFVGIIEADSYQSVIYGASAFSRVSGMPLVLDVVNTELMRRMAVPSFDGISSAETLRYVQTADPSRPLGDDNPAGVAIIPLADQGTAAYAAFAAAYAKRSAGHPPFVVFEAPQDTNRLPRVATALSGHHLLTSTSPDALAWAWENRSKLIDAPAQNIPGTVRMLVNPQRLADILGSRGQQANAFINLDKLIRDFDTLSFALNVDGQSLTLTLRGKPLENTPLHALTSALREPTPKLWNGVPGNAFLSSVSASGNLKQWDAYLGKSTRSPWNPMASLVPAETLADESLIYLAPPRSKTGLCLVQIIPVKDAEAVRQAIQKLQNTKIDERISLVRRSTPSTPKALPIETYDVKIRPLSSAAGESPKSEDNSFVFTIASLFLKHAVLEAAVTDGYLVAVLGPASGTLEGELPALTFAPKPVTLQRQLVIQNPALDGTVTSAAFLKAADLLRHIASIMPGIKPEQLRALSASGDGANFGLSKGADQTLTVSLAIQSNEITALQRINRDGREVLQELFFQMFTSQMMNLDKKDETPQLRSAP